MICQRTMMLAVTLAGLLLGAAACKNKEGRADEKLRTIEQQDRQLMVQEERLLDRRGALQRERTRIRDERAQLLTKKMTLDEADTQAREQLEQEESKLATQEASLAEQETTLNQKLQTLLEQKTGLVDKLTQEKGDVTREMLVARREHGMARREKDLAHRETELARRERELAQREQSLAQRQAKLCPQAATQTIQVIQPVRPRESAYGRKDVEPVFNAALSTMNSKGILTADLPPGVDRLITETRHAVAKGDFGRAKFAADQLLATVRSMRVDRTFISAKIVRLGAAIKRAPPSGAKKAEMDRLFQQATASYGDGRFVDANRKLNQIYASLR